MILRAPTASYISVLPKTPDDPTSVVFTISAKDPPRATADFVQIPEGIKRKLHGEKLYDKTERRKNNGDLVFVTKSTNQVKVTSGAKLYSYGQVFDFDTPSPSALTQISGNENIVTKHNNNYVDPATLGLTDEELAEITTQAVSSQDKILADITTLQKKKLALEADIVTYQKSINEINKVIIGLNSILGISMNEDIAATKVKLEAKVADLTAKMAAATDELNAIPALITAQVDALNNLVELVK